jgi:methylphosphotriester-DNA--protein-cysteine methyltransferase
LCLKKGLPLRDGAGIDMIFHTQISDEDLRKLARKNAICLGGNKKLKIYGMLSCKSGKKMKKQNRVFFISEEEALTNGYRPCGHCMPEKYKQCKTGIDRKV